MSPDNSCTTDVIYSTATELEDHTLKVPSRQTPLFQVHRHHLQLTSITVQGNKS